MALRLREPSAAQNETVNQVCTQCGAVNGAETSTCCSCGIRLSRTSEDPRVVARAQAATAGNLAIAHDWRDEVAHRLEAYRARRRHAPTDSAQPAFSFVKEPTGTPARSATASASAPKSPIQSWHYRPRRLERVEIDVAQPAFDFTGAQSHPAGALATPQTLFPVAPLAGRTRAGLRDAAMLLFAYGGFLTLFAALGGHFSFSKLDIVITAATFVLFYTQYFTLFTFFGGVTPGMMLCGMRVVTFDGAVPTPRQMLWRSFGYMVSAGTMMLGFVWALWDEDHLCWHDRISQTYLTVPLDSAAAGQAPRPVSDSQQAAGA